MNKCFLDTTCIEICSACLYIPPHNSVLPLVGAGVKYTSVSIMFCKQIIINFNLLISSSKLSSLIFVSLSQSSDDVMYPFIFSTASSSFSCVVATLASCILMSSSASRTALCVLRSFFLMFFCGFALKIWENENLQTESKIYLKYGILVSLGLM